MLTLSDIKEQVEKLGERIHVPAGLLPTYRCPADGGLPHIETDSDENFHRVIVERSQELERRTTLLDHELLFWVFGGITFSMACAFKLAHKKHT